MNNFNKVLTEYLDYCSNQKRLSSKTIRAYSNDLKQFGICVSTVHLSNVSPEIIEEYIKGLHDKYRPKTVKRKIA